MEKLNGQIVLQLALPTFKTKKGTKTRNIRLRITHTPFTFLQGDWELKAHQVDLKGTVLFRIREAGRLAMEFLCQPTNRQIKHA